MNFSLNEVEATAKRATRGAGYTWGSAEEAAKAARWLCAQGIDGVAELSRLLECGFASSTKTHSPNDLQGDWDGVEDLCPLMTGVLLSDRPDCLQTGPVRIKHLASPLILLPFAAHVARHQKVLVTIEIGDFHAATDGEQLEVKSECPTHAENTLISSGGTLTNPRVRRTRAKPDPSAWETLTRFAHLTYAPATEESRLLGAGAGLSDND